MDTATLERLTWIREGLGFDASLYVGKQKGKALFSVRCSQCERLHIQGIPTHETGCPNATHECRGCFARIPVRQRFCADCQ